MEVKSIQANNIQTPQIVTCKKVTNPCTGNTRYIEIPNITSQNYAFNVSTPQSYKHINSFEIPQVGKAHFYKLQNGQKVIIVPTEGETIVKTHVNVGSMNEPDNIRGISHFIEHNLFNGTQDLDAGEFFKQTNQMGAKTNASTGFSKTDYYIATHLLEDKDLAKTIKLHADMVENPAFRLEQLEKEKGPVISEIAMVLDNDKNLAINKAIKNLFQIQSQSTDIIAGEAKNIQNITRDDVTNYYKTWYTPENMVTVVTGDVDEKETIELISKSFNKKATNGVKNSYFEQIKPIKNAVREDFISLKAPTSDIIIATTGAGSNQTKENIKTEALLTYLFGYKSAILNKEMQKLGANVGVNIERLSNIPSQPNAIIINAEVAPEKTEKALQKIYNAIEHIYKNPPSKEDVETVKKHMLKNYSMAIMNNVELNNYVAQGFLNCDYTAMQKLPDIINSLSPQDLQQAALNYLNLNKASIVVSHAKDTNAEKMMNNYTKTNKVVSFGSSKKEEVNKIINTGKLRQIILPNNATIVLNEAKTDMTSAQIMFNTPIPTQINPVAPYILKEILLFGYNDISNDAFNKNLDRQAISLNFEITDKGLFAYVNANEKDLNNGLTELSKVLKSPKFDEKYFEKALQKAYNTIITSVDTSYDIAMKEIFGDKYKRFGTKEDYLKELKKIKLSDIEALYQYIQDNSSCIAAISMKDIDKVNQKTNITKTLSQIGNNFKDIEYGLTDTFIPVKESKIIKTAREQKQANITQIYTFKQGENLKDRVSVDLLNTILGGTPSSRLFNDLREKQKLAYRVNSYVENYGNAGVIRLGILTTTEDKENNVHSFENVQKSLDGFEKHINLLKTQNVPTEELEGAKRFLKSKIMEIKDSQNAKTSAIVNAFTKHEGSAYYNKYMQMIDNITQEDIKNAANYVFANENVTSIVASKNTINSLN